jgi:hypothetical protein
MGEENWAQREPGSAAGSVVPPPAAEIAPALPKRIRHKSGLQSGRPRQVPAVTQAPQLPESLRSFFSPVLSRSPADEVPDQDATVLRQPAEPAGAGAVPPAGADRSAPTPTEAAAGAGGWRIAVRWLPVRWLAARWLPVRRLFARRQAGGSTSRRRLGWAFALTAILLAAGGTAIALSRPQVTDRPGDTGGTRVPGTIGTATGGLSDAGAARVRAAAWISREVSRSAIIACDAVMCSSLFDDGLPASNLLVLSPTASDPLGADVVVVSPAVRNQFGSRLSAVYAQTVLASFGSGATRVEVRVVAPDGAAVYRRALSADIAARKVYGVQLLRNKRIGLASRAVVELAAGWIDSRLLLMLPVLASRHPIRVLAFGDQAPGAGWGVPLTAVELSGSGQVAGLTDRAYVSWMRQFLHDQRPPYRAASVTTAHRGHQIVIIVRFTRPSPLGLLGKSDS